MTAATGTSVHDLQLLHAAQWLYAVNDEPFAPGDGDPYARLVRGFDEDTTTVLASIRARGPLWRSRLGGWVCGHHETAVLLLDHPGLAAAPAAPAGERWLPSHERQRDPAFARALARRCAPTGTGAEHDRWRDAAGAAVSRLPTGAVELVADLVVPLTAAVAADALEVPGEQRTGFAAALAAAAPAVDALLCPQTWAVHQRSDDALRYLRVLFRGRAHADADLVAAVAGVRAAADVLGNALEVLLTRPPTWERLRRDPAHAEQIVDEVLRLAPPWRAHPLVASTPVPVAGQEIATGETVTVVTAAAPGAPAHHLQPERFDRPGTPLPDGLPGPVLPLARDLAGHTLRALADRFPAARPLGGAVRHRRAPITRRLSRLPARLGEEETR